MSQSELTQDFFLSLGYQHTPSRKCLVLDRIKQVLIPINQIIVHNSSATKTLILQSYKAKK